MTGFMMPGVAPRQKSSPKSSPITSRALPAIKSVQELMQLKFTGRGGTDITTVIEWANQNKPQLLMVFTDGFFRFPGIRTKVPTTWLIHNNPTFAAPFGKVVHYEI